MYRSGIAHRRGYAIIALIAVIAVAAWLIQAQLGNSTKKKSSSGRGPAPAANQQQGVAPQAPDGAANAAAPGGDGYGDYGTGNGAAAPATVTAKRTKSLTAKKVARMGDVVLDDENYILYRFDKDIPNPASSTCLDACAQKWPPVTLEDGAKLTGLDASKVGSITRPDGLVQVTLGNWALYRYTGDTKPGQWKGQAVGNVWFVAAPDGKKNLTCLPSVAPAG